MKARFVPDSASPVPKVVVEAENDLERMLIHAFVSAASVHNGGGLILHGYGGLLGNPCYDNFSFGVSRREDVAAKAEGAEA